LAIKIHDWLKKVNAPQKNDVDFFFFGVSAETKNGLKNGKNPAQNQRDCAKKVSAIDSPSLFAFLKQLKVCVVLF
jgi:hypothetical protein